MKKKTFKTKMGRCHIIYVLSLGFVAALNTEAAISPLDETYTASVDTDLTIPWSFNHEADMSSINWYHKSTATPTLIMSKSGTNAAEVFSNFNIEHVSNGEVKLISVTMDNAGIYYCEVSYSLVSGYPPVTGTATISIGGPFTTLFPGTLQQIHIKDNKVPVKGGEVQIVCDIVHFSDADTVMVYKTDSILTADITTAQSLASCNPARCFGTEPRHTFSSSYSGVIISITNLYSSDDQKYWTCVMNNQQISMQLTVYYSRSDLYTSTTETSYTMSIVLGAVCFVVLIYAIGLTILYKRKTKKEGSASNSANGTYTNENLGNISDATVAQHYENEATVLPSPQYTELAHYTNERTTYERLQN